MRNRVVKNIMLNMAMGSNNLCSSPCPQAAECTCSEASQVLEQTLSSLHQMGYITWVVYARYVQHSIWMEQNGLWHMIQRRGEEPLGYADWKAGPGEDAEWLGHSMWGLDWQGCA